MSSGAKSNKPFEVRREQRINYGERLLPRVLDDMAARNPDHIIALTPKSGTTLPLSFTSISSSQLANAVNVTSYLLDKLLTNNGYETKATIAFIGLQDFRYAVMELASMKTFHPLLLPSPRNALPNTASLIKDAGTKILFFTGAGTALEAQAQALQSLIPGLQIYSLSSLEEMATTKTKPYPYTALYSEIKDQKAIIVHTSGSTGDPKPIAYTHAYLARVDCEVLIPVPDGRIVGSLRLQRENEMNFFGGPFFHLSGVCIVSRAIFGNVSYVMGPIDRPLTGKIAYEIARSVEIRSILATPGVVDGLFGEFGEELKSLFRGLRFVCWFGGMYLLLPLSESSHALETDEMR
jgi:acyl-CoA synthetase (AMP-forming)/AMP-acid ligase II